jgi:hypothetical protein
MQADFGYPWFMRQFLSATMSFISVVDDPEEGIVISARGKFLGFKMEKGNYKEIPPMVFRHQVPLRCLLVLMLVRQSGFYPPLRASASECAVTPSSLSNFATPISTLHQGALRGTSPGDRQVLLPYKSLPTDSSILTPGAPRYTTFAPPLLVCPPFLTHLGTAFSLPPHVRALFPFSPPPLPLPPSSIVNDDGSFFVDMISFSAPPFFASKRSLRQVYDVKQMRQWIMDLNDVDESGLPRTMVRVLTKIRLIKGADLRTKAVPSHCPRTMHHAPFSHAVPFADTESMG